MRKLARRSTLSILYGWSNLSAGCFRKSEKSFFGEFIRSWQRFDGYVYIIDGKTGCRDVIDVGETSYSIPLIDDLSNSGYLSIVLATMNGEVHCFEAMRLRSNAASLGRTTVSIFIHELDDTQEQVFRYLRRRSRLFRCSRRIHDD